MSWPKTPEMAAINRRRDAIHISSILYYKMDVSMFSDAFFDKISKELVELHRQNPDLVHQGYEWLMFQDWDGSTGFHLETTPYAQRQAELTRQKIEDQRAAIAK